MSEYAHLAPFVRRAPLEQVHGLFQAVGAAALERLELHEPSLESNSAKTLWLSTSGTLSLQSYWPNMCVACVTYVYLLFSLSLVLPPQGLGVYWLHVRLDDRPKYYTHVPYRSSS